jgi:peptidoglycan/LPS O-acetylase OafA/YrhL
LVHEMLFYTLFATRYISRGFFPILSSMWVALIIGANLFQIEITHSWAYVLSPLNLEFMLGVVLARVALRPSSLASPLVLMMVAGLAVAVACTLPYAIVTNRLMIAVAFGLLVLACCRAELLGMLQPPRWAVFLGAASYAIYLVHVPAISVLARLGAWSAMLSWSSALFVFFCGATAAGVLYHISLEAPAVRWTRQHLAA